MDQRFGYRDVKVFASSPKLIGLHFFFLANIDSPFPFPPTDENRRCRYTGEIPSPEEDVGLHLTLRASETSVFSSPR